MRCVVIQTAPLGDVVLSTALLRHLAELSGNPVDCVTHLAAAQLLEGQPWLGRVETLQKRGRGAARELILLARRLRSRQYDVAIAAQRSHRSAVLVRAAARRRIGFADAPGRWAYTASVVRDWNRHASRRYLELLHPLGIDGDRLDPQPRLQRIEDELGGSWSALDSQEQAVLQGPWIALAPGSARPTKQWPAERFSRLASELAELGFGIGWIGAPEEAAACEAIRQEAGRVGVVLAGRSSPRQSAGWLRRARCLVANDSFPGHLASAVGTPVVTIYGPTAPSLGFRPLGAANGIVERPLECRPCHRHGPQRCPLGHHDCMRGLDVASVRRVVEQRLR